MKSWPLLLLALAACDEVYSLDRAFDAPPDSPPDAPPDAEIDAPPPCVLPTGTGGSSVSSLPGGPYVDFSVTEDEQLALVTRSPGQLAEYTEAPLGMMSNPTGILGAWARVVVTPEGDIAFLADASGKVFMSRRLPSKLWSSEDVIAGMGIGFPGRPSADTARIVLERGGALQEYARTNDTWAVIGPRYVSATLGHAAGLNLTHGSLTADGRFLTYVVAGVGSFIRQRTPEGSFGSEANGGRMLSTSDTRFPILIGCTRLYVLQTATNTPFVFNFGQ